jgi:ribulose-phosphate 3-epimerase
VSATICPTVLAENPDDFERQLDRLLPFATRVHLDLSDGDFAPSHTIALSDLWWPGNLTVDLHVMYRQPLDYAEEIIALHPRLVIVHAEADGDFEAFSEQLHAHGIEVGVALLPETKVEAIAEALNLIDHVLIFSGHLGHFGGQADQGLLDKARELKQLKPSLELGWDGGVNDQNAKALIDGGIDVLDVGGYIQHASNPEAAYATLKNIT